MLTRSAKRTRSTEQEKPRRAVQPEQNTEEQSDKTTTKEACGTRVAPYTDLDGKSFHLFYTLKTLSVEDEDPLNQAIHEISLTDTTVVDPDEVTVSDTIELSPLTVEALLSCPNISTRARIKPKSTAQAPPPPKPSSSSQNKITCPICMGK